MPKSKETTSKSTTQTTTDQSIEDNRVVVSDEGVGVGKVEIISKGDLAYTQQFSPDVAQAFTGLIELSRDAGVVARDAVTQSIKSTEQTTQDFMEGLAEVKTGTGAIARFLPYTLVIIGGLVLIAIFGRKRK